MRASISTGCLDRAPHRSGLECDDAEGGPSYGLPGAAEAGWSVAADALATHGANLSSSGAPGQPYDFFVGTRGPADGLEACSWTPDLAVLGPLNDSPWPAPCHSPDIFSLGVDPGPAWPPCSPAFSSADGAPTPSFAIAAATEPEPQPEPEPEGLFAPYCAEGGVLGLRDSPRTASVAGGPGPPSLARLPPAWSSGPTLVPWGAKAGRSLRLARPRPTEPIAASLARAQPAAQPAVATPVPTAGQAKAGARETGPSASLRAAKARYDNWRCRHQHRAAHVYRLRYADLWQQVFEEVTRKHGRRPVPRQVASIFVRRAVALARVRGEPPERLPKPPADVLKDYSAYQRAFRELWDRRRSAEPALWAHCSAIQGSKSRAWSDFRRRWGRAASPGG